MAHGSGAARFAPLHPRHPGWICASGARRVQSYVFLLDRGGRLLTALSGRGTACTCSPSPAPPAEAIGAGRPWSAPESTNPHWAGYILPYIDGISALCRNEQQLRFRFTGGYPVASRRSPRCPPRYSWQLSHHLVGGTRRLCMRTALGSHALRLHVPLRRASLASERGLILSPFGRFSPLGAAPAPPPRPAKSPRFGPSLGAPKRSCPD